MDVRKILHGKVETVLQEAGEVVNWQLIELAKGIAGGLLQPQGVADVTNLEESLDDVRDAAMAHDCAEFVLGTVLKPRSGRVVSIRLSRDADVSQERISEVTGSRHCPNRGFVYIAWSLRPEVFYYVGKARNATRLNLASHGKLTRAIVGQERATQLSLLFPASDDAGDLVALETSIMCVAEWRTGDLPLYNRSLGRIPCGTHLERLGELGNFLASAGKHLAA